MSSNYCDVIDFVNRHHDMTKAQEQAKRERKLLLDKSEQKIVISKLKFDNKITKLMFAMQIAMVSFIAFGFGVLYGVNLIAIN